MKLLLKFLALGVALSSCTCPEATLPPKYFTFFFVDPISGENLIESGRYQLEDFKIKNLQNVTANTYEFRGDSAYIGLYLNEPVTSKTLHCNITIEDTPALNFM